MVKLKNIKTGDIIEKSEVNWKNLQPDLKANYIVLDGSDGQAGKGTLHFSPPELEKKEAAKAPQPEGNSPEASEETQEQQILRLYKKANPKNDADKKAAIKEIAKEVAAHYKTVEKVINASA